MVYYSVHSINTQKVDGGGVEEGLVISLANRRLEGREASKSEHTLRRRQLVRPQMPKGSKLVLGAELVIHERVNYWSIVNKRPVL